MKTVRLHNPITKTYYKVRRKSILNKKKKTCNHNFESDLYENGKELVFISKCKKCGRKEIESCKLDKIFNFVAHVNLIAYLAGKCEPKTN